MAHSEYNKGRARGFFDQVSEGDMRVDAWIKLISVVLCFLLARYINED